jgi:hypothetical protein
VTGSLFDHQKRQGASLSRRKFLNLDPRVEVEKEPGWSGTQVWPRLGNLSNLDGTSFQLSLL